MMKRNTLIFLFTIFCLVFTSCTQDNKTASGEMPSPLQEEMNQWTPSIGGLGGFFLYAGEGQLKIEIEKRDRNLEDHRTDLTAIFVGPDREVIAEKVIPDDGSETGSGLGPAKSIELSAQVERPGVYAVMVIVSKDRYGEDIAWRFRTNAGKYMIETARGHKDEPHQEPIVLLDPEREAEVCFLPPSQSFDIEVTNLPDDVEQLSLWDGENNKITDINVKNDTAKHSIEKGERSATPWRLALPEARARVQIDGVTRWGSEWDEFNANTELTLWTPNKESWFALQKNRWLVTPYSLKVYGQPGDQKSVQFRIHNNGRESSQVNLSLEFPQDEWEVNLSDQQVNLGPGEQKMVSLNWTGMAEDKEVALRATSGNYSTYATLKTKTGLPPANQPLDLPLVLEPFSHENQQLGYLPEYPVENQVYFNRQNRPYIRTSDGLTYLNNGEWQTAGFKQPVTSAHAGNWTKIAFDSAGDTYALGLEDDQPVLLYLEKGSSTVQTYPIPGDNEGSFFDIEQFSGHNVPQGPPTIVRYTRTHTDEDIFWRRYGPMELLIPEKTGNGIAWKDPVLITDKSLGMSLHSGLPSSVVSKGSKIHLAWGEATDPEADVPGVPAYTTTYDRETAQLSEPTLIGYGPPPNDVHNTPSITMDGQGYLHALTGTHGDTFEYAKSLDPNSTKGGWTENKPVGEDLRQTYIGMVTAPDNTIHIVFRLWRENTKYFPENYFAALAHMSKKPGGDWSEPQTLVVAPFPEYSIYYHRLTIDREGNLFLSYDYWSTYWFYRNDHLGRRRALMMSPDGGSSWKMVSGEDLAIKND